jgi:predicted AAA+ superfamily ATPase
LKPEYQLSQKLNISSIKKREDFRGHSSSRHTSINYLTSLEKSSIVEAGKSVENNSRKNYSCLEKAITLI